MFWIVDATAWSARARKISRPRYSLLVSAAIFVVYLAVVHPWLENWGATPTEQAMVLPGDDLPSARGIRYTRAVTIAAPPEAIWPWLLQVGQDRSGFYSYAWLENLVFTRMPAVHEIRSEWQQRALGDRVPMFREDILSRPAADATYLPVDVLEPGRAIGHLSCVFVLQPIDERSTRLLCRQAITFGPIVRWLLWDPMHFTMERRMMLGIKALAEGRAYPPRSLEIPARIGWTAAGAGLLALFLARRRHWPWLLFPTAHAVPVFWATADVDAALAGFLAIGITVMGALLFGRRWWVAFSLIVAVVLLLLVVVPEAYVAFGLIFDFLILLALALAFGSWRRRRMGLTQGPTMGAA